jgi:hypothetical protein
LEIIINKMQRAFAKRVGLQSMQVFCFQLERTSNYAVGRWLALLFLTVSQTPHTLAQGAPAQDCSKLLDPQDRASCEERFSQSVRASSSTAELDGGWRLVRTPNPQGGGFDAISIMHISDTVKSDFALAGLTFRCGISGIEPLLIVLEPLATASNPQVRLTAGSTQSQFQGATVQGGLALLLPATASSLATGPWQTANELSVEIAIKPVPIKGTVPLSGLSNALRTLTQMCASR